MTSGYCRFDDLNGLNLVLHNSVNSGVHHLQGFVLHNEGHRY